ncbi:MAG: hypothetical protein ABI119_05940 [Gemmatimonadaceae bacterium]
MEGLRAKLQETIDRHQHHHEGDELTVVLQVVTLEALSYIVHRLNILERMERHIMAVDDAIFADFTQMASDIQEMKDGVANLLVQLEHGNTQGAQDEATKIQAALDPMAAAMRAAAAQFDPAPAPTPDPNVPPVDPNSAAGHRAAAAKHGKK